MPLAAPENPYNRLLGPAATTPANMLAAEMETYPPAAADPIAQFNQLYQAGDYAAAGQLAAAHGYTPDQVTGYLNNTFGTNYGVANVAPFMSPADAMAAEISGYTPSGSLPLIDPQYQFPTLITPGPNGPQLADPTAAPLTSAAVAAPAPAPAAAPAAPSPLYSSLTAQSTPEQIAAAYDQYVQSAGGETPATQQAAAAYLSNLGLNDAAIQQAYQTYQLPRQFIPEGGIVNFDSLNKGFEWAQANKVDEAALRKTLGEETYAKYADQYKQGILDYLNPVFADNQISAQEALDTVTLAKKYGLDATEIAKYTGLNQSVPDALFSTYDKALTGIIANSLKPETSEVERAKTGLALQAKYGLTDADLAKYSGGKLTEQDVTNFYAPIRSFGTDLQSKFSDPNSTAKDIVSFIDKAQSNPALAAVYSEKLAELKPQIDDLRRLADVGMVKDYTGAEYNPLALMKLAGQIGKNMDTSRISGGAFGTKGESIGFNYDEATRMLGREPTAAEQVVFDMARSLLSKGVTDISQLKSKEYDVPEQTIYGEGGDSVLPGYRTAGIFAGDTQLSGNEFGATYTGKGNTRYNVDIDPATGQPKFYTTAQSSSDLSGGLGALIGLGLSFFGAPMLGSLLGNLGVSGLANTVLSQGILGGTMSELQGGDFGKGFLGGAAGAGIGSLVSGVLPTDWSSAVKGAVTNTAGNLARSAVTGQGDLGDILTGGIMSGAMNYALDPVFKSLNLSPTQVNLMTGIAAPLLTGKSVNPYTVLNGVIQANRPTGG